MKHTLLFKDILPLTILFGALIGGAILVDWILHVLGYAWIGRYFGISGALFILASFAYSLRKYNFISKGSHKTLLGWHEFLAWSGSLMILVHGGIHFNAWLPWYGLAAMVMAVVSGLTGKYLLKRSQTILESTGTQETGKSVFLNAVTFELMKKWRLVHLPITLLFCLLAFLHILTIFIFWGWR